MYDDNQKFTLSLKVSPFNTFFFQFQGVLPSSDDGSLIIDTGRCILLPMTINPCSTRQFPDDPVTIEIIEGDQDEDDPSLSSSNDDVKPERVAYITTTVPWEVSIPEEKALVRHHSPSLNTSGYENVRKTYNLTNTKTLLKVGYIDLGLRLTCMGTNIWNRLKKMNKFKQQSSESDRSPIISEPQTEDENGNHHYIFLIQFSTSYLSNFNMLFFNQLNNIRNIYIIELFKFYAKCKKNFLSNSIITKRRRNLYYY